VAYYICAVVCEENYTNWWFVLQCTQSHSQARLQVTWEWGYQSTPPATLLIFHSTHYSILLWTMSPVMVQLFNNICICTQKGFHVEFSWNIHAGSLFLLHPQGRKLFWRKCHSQEVPCVSVHYELLTVWTHFYFIRNIYFGTTHFDKKSNPKLFFWISGTKQDLTCPRIKSLG